MTLSAPRALFGVHSVSPYNRTTGLFLGTAKVLTGSSVSLSGETVDLMGGSSKYPWASEDGAITSELTLKLKELHDFMFELFLGKAVTPVSAEASGNASTLTAKNGTSAVAATGMASVGVKSGSEADLKFGKYVVKVASATTVDVYFSSDADIGRGTDGEYQDDLLKVTASALTITTATAVTIPNFGLELTGGAGTIAMTTGDTATFSVRPIHTGATTVRVGGQADQTFPEFGAIVMGQKRGNGELVEIDLFRCKAVGMPIPFEMNAWQEIEVKAKVLYDSDEDAIFELRHVKAS